MFALNFMSDGKPKIKKTYRKPAIRKSPVGYGLNFMSNGKPKTTKTLGNLICPEGKMINPKTGRCVKIPMMAAPKTCPEGKMINPLTGRCIKIPVAPELDFMLNGKPRTMGYKARKPRAPAAPKTCPEGKMINPLTGRCIKIPVAAAPKTKASPVYALNFMANGKPKRMTRTYKKKAPAPVANNWMFDYMK